MAAAPDEKPKLRIIVKKKGGHGHHGGAWKVAYADLVTAMMALFMVLWLMAAADPKTKKDIARYFRDPGLLSGGAAMIISGGEGVPGGKPSLLDLSPTAETAAAAKQAAQAEEATLQKEAKALSAELDRAASESSEMADLRKQVIISVAPEGLQIQLVDKDGDHDLLFNTASSELKPALVALLRRISATLAKIDNPLVIGGHTDARAFVHGAGKTNWDLSYERASAARKVLDSGPLAGRIHRVTAYGSSEPFNAADPNAAENRRLTLVALRKFKVVPLSAKQSAALERPSAEKAPAEKGADKAAAEKVPAEKTSADKATAEKAPVEKAGSEKTSTDKVPAEKASAEKVSADKAGADKGTSGKSAQITAEKVAAARLAAAKSSPEK